jgi:RHS repeat-associated protein
VQGRWEADMLNKRVKSKELRVKSEKNFLARLFSFFCLLLSVLCLLFLSGTGYAQVEEDDDVANSTQEPTQSPFTSNSGVAKKDIPIIVPQGRKGIEPRISIKYNSNSQNGWLGIGWTLDMGAIQRETRWGLNYTGPLSDQYNFVINNLLSRLVPRGDWGPNYYGAKIESEFTKYYYDTASKGWIVTARNGTKYYYGSTLASRLVDPADTTRIFKWCLDKVQDTNGNYMVINYWQDTANNEIYLNEITYTGNSNTGHPPDHKVRFIPDNVTRPDAPVMNTAHFTVKTIYRLKTIEISSGSIPVRKYELSYLLSGTTSRSLLSGVQEYGFSNTGPQALPKIGNTYYQESNGEFAIDNCNYETRIGIDTLWNVTFADIDGDKKADMVISYIGEEDANGNGKGVKLSVGLSKDYFGMSSLLEVTSGYGKGWKMSFADVNGNGMADAIAYYIGKSNGDARLDVALSNGDGSFGAFNRVLDMTSGYGTGWKFTFADVNGDGKTDAIASYIGQSNSDARLDVALSNGNGSFSAFNRVLDMTSGYGTGWKFRFADVNGDGMIDAIANFIGDASAVGVRLKVALSNGNGTFGNLINTPSLPTTGYGTGWKFAFADVNGDGMADAVANYIGTSNGDAKLRVALSKGDGTFEGTFNETILATSGLVSPWKFTFADINGDGMTDAVAYKADSYSKVDVSLSKGDRTFAGFVSTDLADTYFFAGRVVSAYGGGFADINGDGKTDVLPYYIADGSYGGMQILTYFATGDTGFNLLKSNNNGLGGTTEIVYTPSSAYDNTYLPFVQQTVSQVTVKDGRGTSSVTTFDYSGGYYSIAQKEYRGFKYVRSIAPYGTTTETWFKQDDVFRGFLYKQITSDSSDNAYMWTDNFYQEQTPPPYNGVNFPRLIQRNDYLCDGKVTAQQVLDGTATTCRQSQAQFTYDNYGNINGKYYLGDVSDPNDQRYEYTVYYQDGEVGSYLVSLPKYTCVSDVLITDCNNNNVNKAKDSYAYYTNTGNLQTKTSWLNTGGPDPVTTYTYDQYGNVATITNPNQNLLPANQRKSTVITYDTLTQTFPEDIWNPLDHNVHKTYDPVFVDRVSTERDPNLNQTSYEYDEFGRIKKITRLAPYGITEYSYPDLNTPGNQFGTVTQHIRKEEKSPSGTLIQWNETYFDGLQRTRTEKQGGTGATRTVIVDTGYNEKGLVYTKTYPYFDGDTSYNIYYTYDPVDRLEYTYNPDNTSSSITYDRGWVTYIDANNHKKEQKKDIYNRNVTVEEYMGNSPATYALYTTTTYWYDVLNNLKTVVDAKGNQTDITYDSLSRKITMDDPDMGYWTYQYDANGNLIYQKDAKLQEINFTYDALNRVTKKDYPTGTDVIYTYDETLYTNPKGRLTTLSDSSGTTKSNYDSMGQITSSIKTIASDNSTYTTQTQYDPLGRVKKIIYPDVPATEVDYTYDGNGNIKDIKSGATTYADYNSYTAVGDPLSIDYGNDKVNSRYQYIPENNRLFQLTTDSVVQGGLINISYNYDNVGNIRLISDNIIPSRTRMYVYDDIDRLIEANSQLYGGNMVYQYDKIGNMLYNCRKGYYEYDSDHPHAVKRIKRNGATVESYNYDLNGNMTDGGGRTLTYDYDNRPTSIIYNGTATVNVYDATGNRIQKMISAPSQDITKYIGQLYECNGGQCTKYIFAGTKRIAQVKGTETYYYHTDHLESSTVITDQNGNKVEELIYYPFGEILTDSSPTSVRYKFAGHEFDSETELIYMGARYYDPKLARFISADTIVPFPFYPQSLNRFSYTLNNPIVLRELDGHCSFLPPSDPLNGGGSHFSPPSSSSPPAGAVSSGETNGGLPVPSVETAGATTDTEGAGKEGGRSDTGENSKTTPQQQNNPQQPKEALNVQEPKGDSSENTSILGGLNPKDSMNQFNKMNEPQLEQMRGQRNPDPTKGVLPPEAPEGVPNNLPGKSQPPSASTSAWGRFWSGAFSLINNVVRGSASAPMAPVVVLPASTINNYLDIISGKCSNCEI